MTNGVDEKRAFNGQYILRGYYIKNLFQVYKEGCNCVCIFKGWFKMTSLICKIIYKEHFDDKKPQKWFLILYIK